MVDHLLAPGPYEPPYFLRRPRTLADFARFEDHLIYWHSDSRLCRAALLPELRVPPAGPSPDPGLPFHQRALPDGAINPTCKAWCFWWLLDRHGHILGTFLTTGATAAVRDRLLDPQCDELPLDDVPWSERTVLDPARPESHRHLIVFLATDWSRQDWSEKMLDACYRVQEVLHADAILTQLAHQDPAAVARDEAVLRSFHLQPVRTCRARVKGRPQVSVWAWTRQDGAPTFEREHRWLLDVTPEQFQALARFYQGLPEAARQELARIVMGFDVAGSAAHAGRHERTIQECRRRLRDALEAEGRRYGVEADLRGFGTQEGVSGAGEGQRRQAVRADAGTQRLLKRYGIDPEHASLQDLTSLFRQPAVSEALKRIAWFYEELPEERRESEHRCP